MWFNTGVIASSYSRGAGDYELISTTILTSNTASVTFSSIPQDYKHLQIRQVVRSARTGLNNDEVYMRLNGDNTGSYSTHRLRGDGSAVSFSAILNATVITVNGINTSTSPSGAFAAGIIEILDAFSTTKNTTLRALTGSASSPFIDVALRSGAWFKSNPVNSMTFTLASGQDFVTGSRFSLYGIRGD